MSKPADRADMRIEVVKRELNQGALAGFDSTVTDYAARLVIAALDSFDQHCQEEDLKAEFRRGFELGERNRELRIMKMVRDYADAVVEARTAKSVDENEVAVERSMDLYGEIRQAVGPPASEREQPDLHQETT